MSTSRQKRTFSVSAGDVTAIDSWVEDVTARLAVSEQTAFRARVCIAELAANVLEHGVRRAENDHITISIDGADETIEVEFSDTRGRFDPTAGAEARGGDQSANGGGRGLVLLHAYAGKMRYANDGIYNRLKFEIGLR